jgi:hypothetical protein
MKKKLIGSGMFLAAFIFAAACNNENSSIGVGSGKIDGDGKVISESRVIDPFNAIKITGVFQVILDQGTKENVRIETDENIQRMILTSVQNGILTLRLKDSASIGEVRKLNVYITLVDISKLSTEGVGTLKCASSLKLKTLDLKSEGVGITELNISGDQLNIHSEIVGALKLSGDEKEVSIEHNGVGMISAFGLKAEKLSLKTDGVGAAEVYATDEISIDASGIGGVKFKGGAQKRHIKNDGVGKVTEVE